MQARGFKELQRQIRTLVGTSAREIRLSDIHDLLCHIFKDHVDLNYISDIRGLKFGEKEIDDSTFKVIFKAYSQLEITLIIKFAQKFHMI